VVLVLLVHIRPACSRNASLHLLLLPSLHLWLAYRHLLPYSVAACAYLLPHLLLVVVHMQVLSKHWKTQDELLQAESRLLLMHVRGHVLKILMNQ